VEQVHALEIETPRLTLVAATDRLARAAAADVAALGELLDARIPASWPPPLMDDGPLEYSARELANRPELAGWMYWYFIRRDDRVLVGCGGFKGEPTERGGVEVGYTVFPEFQRSGYATEATTALIGWAFADARVTAVAAETYPELAASIRVMEKNGLTYMGTGIEPRVIRYAIDRHTWLERAS
jgi:ribosomal-protein-alanine N-acetyltransferase